MRNYLNTIDSMKETYIQDQRSSIWLDFINLISLELLQITELLEYFKFTNFSFFNLVDIGK